ncbi:DUF4256 domain-containing protein [Sphingobacterium sp. HJSM2_6]|uniref:DUF4256 domain-containing protein n=1 Tax=Sphingobacterium sp. HJSM2_6 TaxID=3366264 RepID=UPI003BD30A4D
MANSYTLEPQRVTELLGILEKRFEKFRSRHLGIKWEDVSAKLSAQPKMLWVLNELEETEGEPDVVGYQKETNQYLFFDCSAESPKGRRSFCYDQAALDSRKEHKPIHSAVGYAEELGVKLLTEEQYQYLQQLGEFDLKTSSWLQTPESLRKLKGAIFGDRRYNRVFIYHNGVESYYAGRGFRVCLFV